MLKKFFSVFVLISLALPVSAYYSDIPESSPFQDDPVPATVAPAEPEIPLSSLVNTSDELAESSVQEMPSRPSEAVIRIAVTGNHVISLSTILEKVTTKQGYKFNEFRVQKDANLIRDLGFFKDVEGALATSNQGAVVTFKVIENPLVSRVVFTGNTVYSAAALASAISTREHLILNYNNMREDMKTIESRYHDRGFSLMRVVNISTPTGTDNAVVFSIVEGVIEGIRLEGNTNTRDKVILRELKVKSGDIFNNEAIMNDARRIYNLNYFGNVNPRFEPGNQPDSVFVVWTVEEKRTSSVNLGGSFGSAQGFSIFSDLNLDNFNGNAELIQIKGEWGSKISSYQLKYSNPWIGDGPKTSFTSRLWNTDAAFDDYDAGAAVRRGGDVVLGRQLDEAWSVSGRTKLEHVEPKTALSNYNVFMLGGSVAYDTRDYWMNPTRGEYYSFNLENNSSFFGMVKNALEITKYNANAQYFYKVMDKQTLAARLSLAEVYGYIKDKDTERLFIGGGTTVRGFADNSPFAKGTRRAMGSLEYRWQLSDLFQLVFFYDFGKMSVTSYSNTTFEGDGRWRTGHGFGFRINTPMGPIRLDMGWSDPRGNVVDTTTGQKEYQTVHFNIGQAF